jgi:uncharacterized protein
MRVEFNEAKNQKNIHERGISFLAALNFDFDTAMEWEDERSNYGETRMLALGYIGPRLHVLCYKSIGTAMIRVISLRKANARERKWYEAQKT